MEAGFVNVLYNFPSKPIKTISVYFNFLETFPGYIFIRLKDTFNLTIHLQIYMHMQIMFQVYFTEVFPNF